MNKLLRANSPVKGSGSGNAPGDNVPRHPARSQTGRSGLMGGTGRLEIDPGAGARFEQPLRLNKARYLHVMRELQPRLMSFAVMITVVVLVALGIKAAIGHDVSLPRWFFGIATGFLLAGVARMTMFIGFAQPRFVIFGDQAILLSGFGKVAPERVTWWSLDRVEPDRPSGLACMQLDIVVRRAGRLRHWCMFLDDDAEIEELRQVLQRHLPHAMLWSPDGSSGLRGGG